jgi:hypothetical protein
MGVAPTVAGVGLSLLAEVANGKEHRHGRRRLLPQARVVDFTGYAFDAINRGDGVS